MDIYKWNFVELHGWQFVNIYKCLLTKIHQKWIVNTFRYPHISYNKILLKPGKRRYNNYKKPIKMQYFHIFLNSQFTQFQLSFNHIKWTFQQLSSSYSNLNANRKKYFIHKWSQRQTILFLLQAFDPETRDILGSTLTFMLNSQFHMIIMHINMGWLKVKSVLYWRLLVVVPTLDCCNVSVYLVGSYNFTPLCFHFQEFPYNFSSYKQLMVFYMADWIDSFHLGVYIDFTSGVPTSTIQQGHGLLPTMMMMMTTVLEEGKYCFFKVLTFFMAGKIKHLLFSPDFFVWFPLNNRHIIVPNLLPYEPLCLYCSAP